MSEANLANQTHDKSMYYITLRQKSNTDLKQSGSVIRTNSHKALTAQTPDNSTELVKQNLVLYKLLLSHQIYIHKHTAPQR